MSIRDNFHSVLERISHAARMVSRDPDEIRLVVVTKTQPVEIIQEAIDAGATDLGENYIEDTIPKINSLNGPAGINWHMIGHVQSRKASLVTQYFQYLHSLDSVKLADRLNKYLAQAQKTLPVLLEFNISGEESKSGWDISNENNWDLVLPDLEKILAFTNLNLQGVMAIPPLSKDPEESRTYYQQLIIFKNYITRYYPINNFTEVSMGMSGDFEIAIQEGSTCVRIGQAIFGPRNK